MTEMRTWLDTVAGRWAATAGVPLPSPDDFERAGQAEMRAEAHAAFQRAHRPDERPAVAITPEQRMHVYAADLAALKVRANWCGDGTRAGDEEIRERLRRMEAFKLSDEATASAEITGPSDGPNSYQLEAQSRMDRAARGVPRA